MGRDRVVWTEDSKVNALIADNPCEGEERDEEYEAWLADRERQEDVEDRLAAMHEVWCREHGLTA